MHKIIEIDGQPRRLESNALLPKKYRNHFGRDLIADLKKLADGYKKDDPSEANMEALERLTWLMLKEGGEDVGETPDEWLATLDTVFGFYEILPEVVELWASSTQTTSKAKKK